MHVLSEPIQRDFATETFCLRRGIDLGTYGRELRTEADIVDEASDLRVLLSAFDTAAGASACV